MSAICGIFYPDGRHVDALVLETMLRSLDHRGIDGKASWQAGSVGLGHQMLHITPESIDEQLPFFQVGTDLAITADARLDNREELFRLLVIPKAWQVILPDSVLILKAYEKWGKDCPVHLLGDFVFAIWDSTKQELFCATDHMGMRPFFYYHKPGLFAFASEIKAIHAVPGIIRAPNLRSLAMLHVPTMLYQDKESTFFDDVQLLSSSTVMTVNARGIHKHEYWSPDPCRRLSLKTEDDYVEAFQEIFSKAVAARLRSAFPVSSMLSGGLDSSAITGTAANLLASQGKGLCALSAVLPLGYAGSVSDERYYIDQLKVKDNLDIDYITDTWRGPFDELDRLLLGAEMPTCPSTHYMNTAVAVAAGRHKARVILNGIGGEVGPTFPGAGYFAELFLQGRWLLLSREMAARLDMEKNSYLGLIKGEIVKPLLPNWLISRWKPRFELEQFQRSSPIRHDFVMGQLGDDGEKYRHNYTAYGSTGPDHRKNQIQLINYYRNFGRRSINFGSYVGYEQVTLSTPFFDKRVMEFCLALPGDMKVRNGYKRYMIRAGMGGILPDVLRYRTTKEPYSPDFHDRYNRQRQQASNILAGMPRTELIKEIVDIEKLEKMLKYGMQTNRCSTPDEFAAMHNVPRGLYLLSFLRTFQ